MKKRGLTDYIIIFIGFVLITLILRELQSFIRPLAVAIILLFLFIPFINTCKKNKIPFWITFAIIIIGLLVLFSYAGILITNSLNTYLASNNTNNLVQKIYNLDQRFNFLRNIITPEQVLNSTSALFKNLFLGITTILQESFTIIFFLIFLIPAYTKFKQNIKKTDKIKKKNTTDIIHLIEKSIPEYLIAKTIISILTGVTSAIILALFGLSPLIIILCSTAIFLFNYIPNIGSIIAVFITIFISAIELKISIPLIALGILLIAAQMLYGNIIEPKYFGKKFNLSPLVILISLFFWNWMWGITGMILAVPIMSIIKIILENIKSTKTFSKFLE